MLSLEDSLEEVALTLSPEGQGKTRAGRVLSGNRKGASLVFVAQLVLSTICSLPPVKPLCLIRRPHSVGDSLGPFSAWHLPTDPTSLFPLKSIFLFLSLLIPISASFLTVSPIPILFSIPPLPVWPRPCV